MCLGDEAYLGMVRCCSRHAFSLNGEPPSPLPPDLSVTLVVERSSSGGHVKGWLSLVPVWCRVGLSTACSASFTYVPKRRRKARQKFDALFVGDQVVMGLKCLLRSSVRAI